MSRENRWLKAALGFVGKWTSGATGGRSPVLLEYVLVASPNTEEGIVGTIGFSGAAFSEPANERRAERFPCLACMLSDRHREAADVKFTASVPFFTRRLSASSKPPWQLNWERAVRIILSMLG